MASVGQPSGVTTTGFLTDVPVLAVAKPPTAAPHQIQETVPVGHRCVEDVRVDQLPIGLDNRQASCAVVRIGPAHDSDSRFTTMASWVVREMMTTASWSGSGFSSRCGTHGGTKM